MAKKIISSAEGKGILSYRISPSFSSLLILAVTCLIMALLLNVYITSVSALEPQAVISLTLINADTNADIGVLSDGATVNFAAIGTNHLNVRADTSPAIVGSVKFGLDASANYRTENGAPYALQGNSNNPLDYYAWTPSLGSHTLTATPYTNAGAGGTKGTPLMVTFTVVNDATPPPPDATPPTVSLTSPAEGAIVSGTIVLSANASDNVSVAGVQFKVNGVSVGAEDVTVPFTIVWNSAAVSDGPAALTAVARDAAGNEATSGVVTV